jgi:hypothetical protein
MGSMGKRKAVDTISADDASYVAQKKQANRTKGSTKKNYKVKVKAMIRWLRDNHTHCVRSKKVVIPLPTQVAVQLLDALCANVSAREEESEMDDATKRSMSVSGVMGC